MPFIDARNLEKKYGEKDAVVHALRSSSFEIASGEFVGIMGESGSGKSTLLSIMGAMNSPSGGSYTVDGLDVYSLDQDQRADFRREYIGFIFQSFHLIPYLSLVENVMLPLITLKTGRKEKRLMALDALSKVGLKDKHHRLPNQVSGGEQERAAIARAIVNKPPVILADEPTGNLDSRTATDIMCRLKDLNESGITIIMVTHSKEYAPYLDSILHMSDG
ncbi:MAG TPA: ABC transporter ATP-binding protein, partial [Deltaproteobacteria bacterium]|nr:ABC transporter ATP-binding protein [Deltaproteobacteria bacterium]